MKDGDIVAWRASNGEMMVDYFERDKEVQIICKRFGATVSAPVLLMTAEEFQDKMKETK